jgi:menaquinone-9 beta-reductase
LLSASFHFDFAIIGGGPAGTAAAITAARSGARVILFEARQFPRHKVCGEFVSAEALDLLRNLLQDSATIHRLLNSAPAIDRTRLWLGNRMLESPVSPAALSIPRFGFDAALWQAAQASGVDCRDNCEVSDVAGNGPFELRTPNETITARTLIIAAGRWSQFVADRALPPGPKWIGLKAHFREERPSLTTDLYFFDHGYCGVQPVSRVSPPRRANPSASSGQALGRRADDVVNACAMVRSDRASSLSDVFCLHPALRDRAANWTAVTAPVSTAPLVYRTPEPARDNILFAGDAAAFIDPFVGDGISIALRSGKAAAVCLLPSLSGQSSLENAIAAYQREYERQFVPLLAAASRVRGLLSLEGFAQMAAFELLRLPGLLPFIIRRTRHA